MKKFLFTLAALLMAGSAFADNYLYLDEKEVQNAELGTTVTVPLKAHFDNYVSAWRFQITSLPEGLTVTNYVRGYDMQHVPYITEDGEEDELKVTLNKNMENLRCLCAITEPGYNEAGQYMGSVHFAPGDYTEMVKVTIEIGVNFKGGDIVYWTEPSATGWGDHSNDCPQGSHSDGTTTWTLHQDTPPAPTALTADITIGEADGLFVPITVDANDPEAEIVVTVGGTEYTIVDGGITLPDYDTDYTVVVTVTAKGEGYEGTVTESQDVHTGAHPTTPAPAPTIGYNEDGQVVATADGHEVELYCNGELVDNPYTLPAAGETAQHLVFTATTVPGQYETPTSTPEGEEFVVDIPAAQPLPTCLAPNSGYEITGTEQATVTITNREEGATVHYVVTCNGVVVEEGDFTGDSHEIIVTGDGDYVVSAIAHKQGYNDSPDGGVFFTITEGEEPTTGINELVNGKTVAGVRYFNMAGQEMTEANGMTIVVTTYTDGTTSAVKVMK